MNLLSIQSHVAYGHVGNSAVVFALQRLGVEVWPVNTLQFSNHTGYESWTGQVFEARLIRDLVRGIEDRGVFAACDGILSGYLGSVEIGAAVLDVVTKIKLANPAARYCCDPVIGDDGRAFIDSGVSEFIRERAVAAADVVTPNQFELETLTGMTIATMSDVGGAIAALRARGPRVVFVTSLRTEDTPADSLDLIASDEQGTFRVRLPLLPLVANGAGDIIAGLFFVHHLRTSSVAEALSNSASSVFGILGRTAEAGARELLLIGAQEQLVSPSRTFAAEPVEIGAG